MSVYLDEPKWSLGRMRMCHMFADTNEELLAMADEIELERRHIQKAGTAEEHFDVSLGKRARAVAAGALEVTSRQLVSVVQAKRRQLTGT